MGKSSSGLKVFFIILGCFLVVCGSLIGLYFSNLLPLYNEKVDQILKLNQISQEETQNFQLAELLKQQTSIQELYPHLLPVTEEELTLVTGIPQPLPSSLLSFQDSYSMSYFGFREESISPSSKDLSSNYSEEIPPLNSSDKALWSYVGEYPIVAPPADFSDALVFIDAEPALVCLDRTSGTEIFRIPCQVYPGTESFSRNTSYYFKSKTGKWYEVGFEKGYTFPERLSPPYQLVEFDNLEQDLYDSLLPQKNTLDFIEAKMNGLLSVSPPVTVPKSILYYPQEDPVDFIPSEISPVFVFSPEEQGTYTLGLCDRDGAWIRDKAFVVLYTMAGEAIAISLDYVADRPQITTHLSDQELYIACAGFFPDTLILDSETSQDFRETPEKTNPLEEHFSGETVIVDTENGSMEMDIIVLGKEEALEKTGKSLSNESTGEDVPTGNRRQAFFQVKRAP